MGFATPLPPETSSTSTASTLASRRSSCPPGARKLLADCADLPAGPSHIAIGCAGGKPRASGLTELLAHELRARGREVVVEHRHAHLSRVLKTPTDTRTSHPRQEANR
ncbi:hypothetical protein ACIPJK_37285 [Streptomyces roseus]|uniref:RapZ C-terminal domain-containing protein n=1 Tax=Streptomyces roseus TaxID=66430 RepID=UPI00380050FE